MKIGIAVKNTSSAVSFYRANGPLGNLSKHYKDINVKIILTPDWDSVVDCDVVFIHNPSTREDLELANVCKFFGIPIWCDMDDNIWEIPPYNPAHSFYKDNKACQVLSMSDAVSVSTLELSKDVKRFAQDKKSVVIRNAIPKALIDFCANNSKDVAKTFLAWRGSATHDYDVMSNIESFRKIQSKIVESVGKCNVYLFGDPPNSLIADIYSGKKWGNGSVFVKKTTAINHYFSGLSKATAGYLYAPLEDNNFNLCKSNIAWIEASICGMACIVERKKGDFAEIPVLTEYQGQRQRADAVNNSMKIIQNGYVLEQVNEMRIELINSLVPVRKRI